jgi:chromate reductase
MNIYAISGSLRKESFNTTLLRAVIARAPEGVSIELADISAVPLYNQDHEADYPAEVKAVKDKILAADGIIIATPEYGRSVPGVLKNLIDWTSRPSGISAWKGKPVYVMGATDGAIGTAVAQKEVRSDVSVSGAIVLGNPEFYLSRFKEKLDANGNLADEKTFEHIDKALAAFVAFVATFK